MLFGLKLFRVFLNWHTFFWIYILKGCTEGNNIFSNLVRQISKFFTNVEIRDTIFKNNSLFKLKNMCICIKCVFILILTLNSVAEEFRQDTIHCIEHIRLAIIHFEEFHYVRPGNSDCVHCSLYWTYQAGHNPFWRVSLCKTWQQCLCTLFTVLNISGWP